MKAMENLFQQSRIIKEELNKPLMCPCYMIEKTWWDDLGTYLNLSESVNPGNREHPGQIRNSILV